jgi:hypothetical protein
VSHANRPERSDVSPASPAGTTDGTNEESSTEHDVAREMGHPVSPPVPPSPLPCTPPPPPLVSPPPPPPPRTHTLQECLEDVLSRRQPSSSV